MYCSPSWFAISFLKPCSSSPLPAASILPASCPFSPCHFLLLSRSGDFKCHHAAFASCNAPSARSTSCSLLCLGNAFLFSPLLPFSFLPLFSPSAPSLLQVIHVAFALAADSWFTAALTETRLPHTTCATNSFLSFLFSCVSSCRQVPPVHAPSTRRPGALDSASMFFSACACHLCSCHACYPCLALPGPSNVVFTHDSAPVSIHQTYLLRVWCFYTHVFTYLTDLDSFFSLPLWLPQQSRLTCRMIPCWQAAWQILYLNRWLGTNGRNLWQPLLFDLRCNHIAPPHPNGEPSWRSTSAATGIYAWSPLALTLLQMQLKPFSALELAQSILLTIASLSCPCCSTLSLGTHGKKSSLQHAHPPPAPTYPTYCQQMTGTFGASWRQAIPPQHVTALVASKTLKLYLRQRQPPPAHKNARPARRSASKVIKPMLRRHLQATGDALHNLASYPALLQDPHFLCAAKHLQAAQRSLSKKRGRRKQTIPTESVLQGFASGSRFPRSHGGGNSLGGWLPATLSRSEPDSLAQIVVECPNHNTYVPQDTGTTKAPVREGPLDFSRGAALPSSFFDFFLLPFPCFLVFWLIFVSFLKFPCFLVSFLAVCLCTTGTEHYRNLMVGPGTLPKPCGHSVSCPAGSQNYL